MRTLILLLIIAPLLGACAGKRSVSENQCVAGDWQTIGYRDGVVGYRSSRLLAHIDACGDHGVTPERDEYMLGWAEGVREYCEPTNGFYVGERGWEHNNVCPADLKAGFQAAYRDGLALYQARADVASLEWELEQKNNRLAEVKSQIVSAAAAQLSADLTPTARIELAARVQRLYEEQVQLRNEIPDVEALLAIKVSELDRLEQSLASR